MSVFSHGDGKVEDGGAGESAAISRCSPGGQLLPLQLLHPPLNATDWLAIATRDGTMDGTWCLHVPSEKTLLHLAT